MHSPEEFTYTVTHTGTKEKPGCGQTATLSYVLLANWALSYKCPGEM
jgi:hypothetical protein